MSYIFTSGTEVVHRLSDHTKCGPVGPGFTSVSIPPSDKLEMFVLSVHGNVLRVKNLGFLLDIHHSFMEAIAVLVEPVDGEDLLTTIGIAEGDTLSISCDGWVWEMPITWISIWDDDVFSPGVETRFFRFMNV